MGVYRQLGSYPPEKADVDKVNILMGTDEWFPIVYKKSKQGTLFDLPNLDYERQKRHVAELIIEFYRKRLTTCFTSVSKAVIMRNMNRGPMYALILASHHALAKKKMEDIFKREERQQDAMTR